MGAVHFDGAARKPLFLLSFPPNPRTFEGALKVCAPVAATTLVTLAIASLHLPHHPRPRPRRRARSER